MKKNVALFLALILILACAACSGQAAQTATPAPTASRATHEPGAHNAARASLEKTIPKSSSRLEPEYDIIPRGHLHSSGKLQTQNRAGLDADVFMSAATSR